VPYTVDEIEDLRKFHSDLYELEERTQIESARSYYNCEIPAAAAASLIETFGLTGDDLQNYLVTKNIVFALIDSAVSALVGGNPTAAATGINPDSILLAPMATGRLDAVLTANRIRRQLAVSLIDAGTTGRGIFKTLWAPEARMSATRAVDPVSVYFDLHDARLPEDIGYWMHMVPVPRKRFAEKAKRFYRKAQRLDQVQTTTFPEQLDPSRHGASRKSPLGWVVVYEFYDEYEKRTYHYHAETNQILMAAGYDHPCPFDLYNLNLSGRDCRGISEAKLVANVQQTLTDLLTLLKAIAYSQLEKTAFDAEALTADEVKKVENAPLGAKVGVNMTRTSPDQKIADGFYKWPSAENPEPVLRFIEIVEETAAFVSALAAAQRGAAANVRTATEAAVIDAKMADRLSNRRSLLYECVESLCYKILAMDRRYLRTDEWVVTGGASKFSRYDVKLLKNPQIRFRITAHTPPRSNPAVAAETVAQLIPYLSVQRAIDQDELAKDVARAAGVSERVIVPDAELRRIKEIEKKVVDKQAGLSEQALEGNPAAIQALQEGMQAGAGEMPPPPEAGMPMPPGSDSMPSPAGVQLVGNQPPATPTGIATSATPATVGRGTA